VKELLILGLNGSPNKSGNTQFLLNAVLETASSHGAQTKILQIDTFLKSAKHPFCTACSSPCSGICFKGTKLEEAFELLKTADGVVFGSPTYFGTISAQLKAFFDKTRLLRNEKGLYNVVGAGVTVGSSKYGGQETTMKALHDIMLVHGMIIVGDGYFDKDCGHHGVSAQKPASGDDNAINRAEILGKRMVEVCKATISLRESRVQNS
jgi:multimeric flavodoxin WrbA